jgi:hypothetical protein
MIPFHSTFVEFPLILFAMATSPFFSEISLHVMSTFLFAGFTAFFIYTDPWLSSLALQPMLPVDLFLV